MDDEKGGGETVEVENERTNRTGRIIRLKKGGVGRSFIRMPSQPPRPSVRTGRRRRREAKTDRHAHRETNLDWGLSQAALRGH